MTDSAHHISSSSYAPAVVLKRSTAPSIGSISIGRRLLSVITAPLTIDRVEEVLDRAKVRTSMLGDDELPRSLNVTERVQVMAAEREALIGVASAHSRQIRASKFRGFEDALAAGVVLCREIEGHDGPCAKRTLTALRQVLDGGANGSNPTNAFASAGLRAPTGIIDEASRMVSERSTEAAPAPVAIKPNLFSTELL